MELRKGKYDDIAFDDVYVAPIGVAIILLIVYVIAVGFAWLVWQSDYSTKTQHNAEANEFNARPPAERAIIADYLRDDSLDDENMMPLEDIGLNGKAVVLLMLPYLGISIPIILSIVTFCAYWYEKDSKYHLANLPLSRPYGWVLLISMFMAWPILLIALLYMLYVEHSDIHKAIVEKRKNNAEERKQIEAAARHELCQEENELAEGCERFSANAEKRYYAFRRKGFQKALEHRRAELNREIGNYQAQLRSLGAEMQTKQRKMGEVKAKLNQIEQTEQSGHRDDVIAEEWRLITEMRGVSRVYLKDYIGILVKVRVPYEGCLYDFGDYEIRISPFKFSCVEVRSGVKANAKSRTPHYQTGSGFCFGERLSEIQAYVQHARMLEAITLMIDCLHSVNEGDEKYISQCFRKLKSIESAKRRLKSAQK